MDPSAAATLSAPSKILLSSLQTGLEVAMGKTIDAVSTQLATAAGDLAGKIIEDVNGASVLHVGKGGSLSITQQRLDLQGDLTGIKEPRKG